MTDPNDDLADVLGLQPAGPSPGLRETLLSRTERRLVRDRWLRRGAKVATVAVLFLVGGAVGWFVRSPVANTPGPPVREVVVAPVFIPVPVPTPGVYTPGSPEAIATAPPLSASEAELRAEQADRPAEVARLYRAAGDSFLRQQDYANATRCYRLYLLRAGDSGLTLEADDSWLLVSLKNAAFKEKTDALKTDS
jgi:hypothetical protein